MRRSASLTALFASLLVGCGPGVNLSEADTDMDTGPGDDGSGDSNPGPGDSTPGQCGYDDSSEQEVQYSDVARWLDDDGRISEEGCAALCGGFGTDLQCWVTFPHSGDDAASSSSSTADSSASDTDDGATGGSDTGSSDTGGSGTSDDGIGTESDGTGMATTDGTSTTGDADASTTGAGITGETGLGDDPWGTLSCEWFEECVGGRGHAALSAGGAARGADAVGQWAAAMAHEESGSVAAFLALADELMAHGAPQPLVNRARAAARDEVVHTHLMTRIATSRGVVPTRPRLGDLPRRSLLALACENAVEGCVRETWGALEATYQAHHADAADIRAAMHRIAVDETRHAELSRDLDLWVRGCLDDRGVAEVRSARRRAIERMRSSLAQRRDRAHGRAAGLPERDTAMQLFEGLDAALWCGRAA